jgi:hypothetical protein
LLFLYNFHRFLNQPESEDDYFAVPIYDEDGLYVINEEYTNFCELSTKNSGNDLRPFSISKLKSNEESKRTSIDSRFDRKSLTMNNHNDLNGNHVNNNNHDDYENKIKTSTFKMVNSSKKIYFYK